MESRAPRPDAMKVLRKEGKCIAFKPVIGRVTCAVASLANTEFLKTAALLMGRCWLSRAAQTLTQYRDSGLEFFCLL